MPKPPRTRDGVNPFPESCDEEWLSYIKSMPNRKLFTDERHAKYLFYLQNPTLSVTKGKASGHKYRALRKYELQDDAIYRQAEDPFEARYAVRTIDAFRIIANIHCSLDHASIRKTVKKVSEYYYGVSESNVAYVVKQCRICSLRVAKAATSVLEPIESDRPMDRIQINMMEFKTSPDERFKYILQIKDHFSQYVWLYLIEFKESEEVVEWMRVWFGNNGYPKIL